MIILIEEKKKITRNWADEKCVTQEIQHTLKMIAEKEKINTPKYVFILEGNLSFGLPKIWYLMWFGLVPDKS